MSASSDRRSRADKLRDMAERGTTHERARAREALQRMGETASKRQSAPRLVRVTFTYTYSGTSTTTTGGW